MAVVAGLSTLRLERAPAARPTIGAASPVTPVLSARRAPELLASPVADRRLAEGLNELLSRTRGSACLTVSAAGRQVFALEPTRPMVPASLQKLVTASVALDVLGPDTTLRTAVRAGGPVAEGVVAGDLYLVGGGDPVLVTDPYLQRFKYRPAAFTSFEALADRIVAAGVTRVEGSVIGDDRRYDNVRYSPLWPQNFIDDADVGPIGALTVNDGFTEFPPSPDVRLPEPAPASDPAAWAAVVMTELLRARGVTVAAAAASGVVPDDAPEVAAIESPPVKDLVVRMLRDSHNLTSEMIVREIGFREGTGTTEAGLAVIQRQLAAGDLPTDGTSPLDGSGLASQDKMTCQLAQAVLDRSGPESALGVALPVAGESGTLVERFEDNPAAGRLRAKTGTLNQVVALAGFIDSVPGSQLSFSYIVNLEPPAIITIDDVDRADELGAILSRYPEGPDLGALGPVPVP
ncbi:MAG: D-alanyl-D-alanine carboxypeptidase/D-alanyl-D-alanine endopeptidase [Acidimicrobiia bacterium]